MKRIVVDTNIYLNFYRLKGDQPIRMLKELTSLIQQDDYELVLFEQIENEFLRGKYSKGVYKDHILNLERQLNVNFVAPPILQKSRHEQRVRNTVARLKRYKEEIVEEYKNRVFNENSKLNKSLLKLFSLANKCNHSNEILDQAYYRTLRGNPPRKDQNSFGDAIIWESILEHYIDEDLVLISGDGDFESEINDGVASEFLSNEWKNKTERDFTFYTNLGSFINDQLPDEKPITEEDIQKEEEELGAIWDSPISQYSLGNDDTTGVVRWVDSPGVVGMDLERKCTCCGAILEKSLSRWGNDRCDNCSYQLSPGQSCSKCGRHFHRNPTRSSISTLYNSLCDECQN